MAKICAGRRPVLSWMVGPRSKTAVMIEAYLSSSWLLYWGMRARFFLTQASCLVCVLVWLPAFYMNVSIGDNVHAVVASTSVVVLVLQTTRKHACCSFYPVAPVLVIRRRTSLCVLCIV